jgi:hypothetical protein
MRKEKLLVLFLVIFLIGDLTYSFLEYYYTPIDGDLTSGIAFNEHIQKIFADPFGFKMLITGDRHINPNRFFSHIFQKEYMQSVPVWLQNLTDPITSVYLSCALLKMFVHLLFLFILGGLISGTNNILKKPFLIVTALLIPFVQVNGYWGHMGINDRATTYVFFFSLPLVLLLAFLTYVYRIAYLKITPKLGLPMFFLSFIAAVVLPLSGPLNPGVVLIVCLIVFVYYFQDVGQEAGLSFPQKMVKVLLKTPRSLYIFLIPIAVVSLYSLLLGRFDSNFQELNIPLSERYLKLPLGIYYQITQSLGVPLLLIIIAVNVFLIKKFTRTSEGEKIVGTLRWIGLFSMIYLLLLPLGGYRPYRPNILRYDTFIPITITLFYFYGSSTYFIFNNLSGKKLRYYGVFLMALFVIYMNSDRIETEKYRFERQCIEALVKSPNEVTKLPATFNVMSWYPLTEPNQSESNAIMLKFWNITKEKKLYYQSKE